MQRLREQTSSSDPTTARAAGLLASRAPLDADRLRRRPLPAVDFAMRRPVAGLRPTLVLALSLGSVVAAAATLQRTSWWRESGPLVGSPSMAPSPAVHERDTHSPARSSNAAPEAPVVEKLAPEVLEPVGAGRTNGAPLAPSAASTRTTQGHPSAASAPRAGANETADSRAAEDESALIVSAVRALRRDRDPSLALALSEQALARYPHGAQVEEAMALVMESASAAGDTATARRAAQRYLEAFRSGRFADRAQQILSALPK